MYARETLTKTIQLERGQLFAEKNGERTLLATCEPEVEVYEREVPISSIGGSKHTKKLHYSIVLCDEPVYTRKVDEDYLYSVSRFTLVADKQRKDGIFERITFDKIELSNVDESMALEFNVVDNGVVDKLLKMI